MREVITGKQIVGLMIKHKQTIRSLAAKMQITQKRIREVREHGVTGPELVRDWMQGIIGVDPETLPSTLTVELKAGPNLDFRPGDRRGSLRIDPQIVSINSFAEASQICRRFIEANDLGAGNWSGGTVRDGQTTIAQVSYSGRIWQPRQGDYPLVELKF